MDLEEFQLILLLRPADASEYDQETTDRIQQQHLAFYAALRRSGEVLTNGPLIDPPQEALRGLAIFAVGSVERAREIANSDPAVQARRLEVQAMAWWCPPRTMIGPGTLITI